MLTKLLHRLAYLDLLIRKRATGCPKELTTRLGITERAWYNFRDELVNVFGLPIACDPQLKTYYYTEAGQFVFQFVRKLDFHDYFMKLPQNYLTLVGEEGINLSSG